MILTAASDANAKAAWWNTMRLFCFFDHAKTSFGITRFARDPQYGLSCKCKSCMVEHHALVLFQQCFKVNFAHCLETKKAATFVAAFALDVTAGGFEPPTLRAEI